jgi:peptidyl-prolyl cis-trans isomerase C
MVIRKNRARGLTLGLAGLLALGACHGGAAKTDSSDSTTPAAVPAKLPPGLPGQPEADLASPVATIDGTTITVAELQDRINKQSPYVRARYTSLEQKKEFLDTLVRFEVLAGEARKRGYDRDPEVVRTMKQVMIQRLLKEEFDSRVKPEDISDDEMKKFYDAHLSDYNKPAEMRASAIVVKDKALAAKVAAEAKLPANADNKNFRDLVTKYSEDEETKQRGGDLRFFTADSKDLPAPVVKAAFDLKNLGDVSAPIATEKGFYVLKNAGERKAISKTYDDVKRQIQNRLYRDKRQQAMQDFEADLKKKAKIDIKSDALAKVRLDTSQPADLSPEMGGAPMPGQPAPPGPPSTNGGPAAIAPPGMTMPPGGAKPPGALTTVPVAPTSAKPATPTPAPAAPAPTTAPTK